MTGRPIITLRDPVDSDVDVFYANQKDPEAVQMAAFTSEDPTDRAAFDTWWERITGDAAVLAQTVMCDGSVAGSVLSFGYEGEREVSFWVGREFWGRGVATVALTRFLDVDRHRPFGARVAHDNVGSLRVLEKCGFVRVGSDRGYANARGEEIDEYLLTLA